VGELREAGVGPAGGVLGLQLFQPEAGGGELFVGEGLLAGDLGEPFALGEEPGEGGGVDGGEPGAGDGGPDLLLVPAEAAELRASGVGAFIEFAEAFEAGVGEGDRLAAGLEELADFAEFALGGAALLAEVGFVTSVFQPAAVVGQFL
jgi:hypothetical protein